MANNRSTTSSDYAIEQKSAPPSVSPLLSTAAILSSTPKFIDYNPEAENEMSPVFIPPVLTSIIIDYLAGDMDTKESKTETASLPVDKSRLTLFGRNCYELMAQKAADLILWGEEKDADEAVLMLKNNSALLDYKVEVTDPRGRSIKQKVYEIAFMAGDFDVKKGITNEKVQGLVERITIACGVSQARIDEAKQVLLSEEAKKENANRSQRILDAFIKFGESIINLLPAADEIDGIPGIVPYEYRIRAYRLRCKSIIDQYKEDLKSAQSGIIQCGYIFDPQILVMADQWFVDNHNRFDNWIMRSPHSDVFDINGYGILQGELSSRDAQVTKSGIGNLVEKGKAPARSLKNADGSSYFYNSQSRLGDDFLINYYEGVRLWPCPARPRSEGLEKFCRAKTTSLVKLTQHRSQRSASRCTIM